MHEKPLKSLGHHVLHRMEQCLTGAFLRCASRRGLETPNEYAGELMRMLNISPTYAPAVSESASTAEMRRRLAKEPGVLIANHPGGIDVVPIVNAIGRNDVLMWVSPSVFRTLGPIFGDTHFMEITRRTGPLRRQLERVDAHIRNGGLFVVFPTGEEEKRKHSYVFQSGFRRVLSRLRPTDIVYASHVEPADIESMRPELPRVAGVFWEVLGMPFMNANARKQPLPVRVTETCLPASRWHDVLSGAPSLRKRNETLKDFYWSLLEGRTARQSSFSAIGP
jgi:hypothetical protein